MTNWEVWAYLPNGDKPPGWALVAERLTQDQAEWLADTLLMRARAMERTTK